MGTWLPESADGDTPFEQVFGLRPDLYELFRAFYSLFWERGLVDPVVLELCRLRMAMLLGCESELAVRYQSGVDAGLTEDKVGALSCWPTDPRFTATERACLGLAEQFVVDPHGVSDGMRAELAEHLLEAELVAFTEALALFDGFLRFRMMMGVEPGAGGPVVVPSPARDRPLY